MATVIQLLLFCKDYVDHSDIRELVHRAVVEAQRVGEEFFPSEDCGPNTDIPQLFDTVDPCVFWEMMRYMAKSVRRCMDEQVHCDVLRTVMCNSLWLGQWMPSMRAVCINGGIIGKSNHEFSNVPHILHFRKSGYHYASSNAPDVALNIKCHRYGIEFFRKDRSADSPKSRARIYFTVADGIARYVSHVEMLDDRIIVSYLVGDDHLYIETADETTVRLGAVHGVVRNGDIISDAGSIGSMVLRGDVVHIEIAGRAFRLADRKATPV